MSLDDNSRRDAGAPLLVPFLPLAHADLVSEELVIFLGLLGLLPWLLKQAP